jgi:chromosome segregation ATPase
MIQEGTYDDTKNELVQSESWMVSLQEGKDLRQEILDIENAKLPLNDKQIKVLRDRQRSLDVEYEDILVQEQNLSESLRNLRSLLQHCSQLMDFEKDVLSQNRKLSEFENNISIQDLKSQIEVVNSRMFVVESESTELSEQISALTERRIHKQNEIANLRNLLQSKREEGLKMNALQSQLSDLENKKSLFSKELQEKQDFLEIVSSQLARNSMESRRLDSALDMKRKEMNEFILSLDDRVQFFESSAKSIQSSISEAQDRSKQISTLRSQTSGVSVRFIYLSSFDFIRLLKTVLMTFSRKFLCLSLK